MEEEQVRKTLRTLQMQQEIASGMESGKRSGQIVKEISAEYGVHPNHVYHIIGDVREAFKKPYLEAIKEAAPLLVQKYLNLYERMWETGDLKGAKSVLDSMFKHVIGSAPVQVEISEVQRFEFGNFTVTEDPTDVDYEEQKEEDEA